MRRTGWTLSAILHLLLVGVFLVWRFHVPPAPDIYYPIALMSMPAPLPAEPEIPSIAAQAATPTPSTRTDPNEEGSPAATRTRIGVRSIPDWVSGPPVPVPEPVDVAEEMTGNAGPLRRSLLASRLGYSEAPVPTALDTLLYTQRLLAEMAGEILADAKAAPKNWRSRGPVPEPGSIEELRGGGQVTPILPLAMAAAGVLMDLGKKAWDRLLQRDPDAVIGPDLDMTYEEAEAFAAMRPYHGVSIFEWHGRMPPYFGGGLGDLQRIAAALADRGLVTMQTEGQLLRYRRVVPLPDVIGFFTAFLNRLPAERTEEREALVRIIAALVREP